MERMLRVKVVKFLGPGFSLVSPESKRKGRRNGLQKIMVCERGNRRQTADDVWVR